MRIRRSTVFFGGGAAIAVALGLLCLMALSGCGRHHHHTRAGAYSNLDQSIEVDEFIGLLGVCWPKDWTDAQKADGRRGVLEHLNAWEAEFGPLLKPAKLIILLSADRVGGIDAQDRGIILVWPGDCFEFPALFNLLIHHVLDDFRELDSRWQRWNAIGAEVATGIYSGTYPGTFSGAYSGAYTYSGIYSGIYPRTHSHTKWRGPRRR